MVPDYDAAPAERAALHTRDRYGAVAVVDQAGVAAPCHGDHEGPGGIGVVGTQLRAGPGVSAGPLVVVGVLDVV
jgi:hypothetical protein